MRSIALVIFALSDFVWSLKKSQSDCVYKFHGFCSNCPTLPLSLCGLPDVALSLPSIAATICFVWSPYGLSCKHSVRTLASWAPKPLMLLICLTMQPAKFLRSSLSAIGSDSPSRALKSVLTLLTSRRCSGSLRYMMFAHTSRYNKRFGEAVLDT